MSSTSVSDAGHERLDHLCVELGSAGPCDLRDRVLGGKRLRVGPRVRDRIEHVCNRNDLSTSLTGATVRRHPHGTAFSFDLDQAATVYVAITTSRSGRRSGHSCKPDNHALRHSPSCMRHITLMTLARTAHAGPNTINFSGRVYHKALNPGHYTAEITATNQAGTTPPHTLNFTIVPN
jgi:hypothetical protein